MDSQTNSSSKGINTMPTRTSTDNEDLENKQKKTQIRFNERSPDLFAGCMDSDEDGDETEDACTTFPELPHTQSNTNDWEKSLLKNLQISLSGVPPPPSKTIIQYSTTELLTLYDENIKRMSSSKTTNELVQTSLLKPSHTVEQIKNLNWEDMTMDMKCHGVHYNRSSYSEDIELLCMKYAERCVGVETSSSFTHDCPPTINKSRLKSLSQSPGTRLSHLVRRKKTLSSGNVMSKLCGSDSSKLGSKQLVIDVHNFSIEQMDSQTNSSSKGINTMPTRTSTDNEDLENKQKKTQIRFNERSPDLFAGCMDSDEDGDETEDACTTFPELPHTQSNTNDWEKSLLKNLQISLSGVPPPPSKTIIQYSTTELLTLYDENIKRMSSSKTTNELVQTSLLKPSHTVEQIKNLNWEDMTMDMKCHGVHYNRSSYSEDIELLCMKYAERCVGVETSSSFTHDCPPTIDKSRLKSLSQSPGTRLSHLVRRKKTLSSGNVMSKLCGSDSSKLGSKQLVIDVQKYERRKRKITTPKRRTPAKKRTPGRTTPGSSRKRLAFATKSATPTRETAKRALFQSPPQQKLMHTVAVDVARRVDKSKRILFSLQSDKSKIDDKLNQTNCGKRTRDEDGLLGNQSKILENTTPRSLLAKSETFCNSKTTNNAPPVYQSSSKVSQKLSESDRQKLLWAVSKSLEKKNIDSKHPKYTAFVTVLAKLIKRLFLETQEVKSASTSISDIMIGIAERHVFSVIQGKTVDEIYANEKIRKKNLEATRKSKLTGYIAPKDYEKQ